MTTPEHTLVGIHLALAAGCHRYWGWPAVALAGIASNVPDWDGLPMLVDMQRFESGHRVWGHNLIAIAIAAALLGWSQAQFRWLEWIGERVRRWLPNQQLNSTPVLTLIHGLVVFTLIAFIAQLVHLPCDMVVSGGNRLAGAALVALLEYGLCLSADPVGRCRTNGHPDDWGDCAGEIAVTRYGSCS